MLKSLRNHGITWSQQEEMADCRWWPKPKKNWSFTVIKSIAIEFVPAKQVGLDVNTIIGDVMASWNSQSIELSGSDDPTWVADWVSSASGV